ncbi:hypothetical protein SFC66_04175 [Terribacillus saccharophilus]|uniref:hypothetical protein n=1 Tax=Terribacillus saccharophilus TaxID=361277 RepID=UPI003982A829
MTSYLKRCIELIKMFLSAKTTATLTRRDNMTNFRRVSPKCPKCSGNQTYDILPQLPNELEDEIYLEELFYNGVSIGNTTYHCRTCNYTWKKYKGRKPYRDIKRIYCGIGGYPGPYYNVEINVDKRQVKHKTSLPEVNDIKIVGNLVTDKEIQWLLSQLYKCDLLNWAEEYFKPVLDGTSWNVRIEYSSYCEIKTGSNFFPEKWDEFTEAVSKISSGDFG